MEYMVNSAFALIGAFLGAYLYAKGVNFAKKEDASDITALIEKVKIEFSKALEDHKASLDLTNNLKLAALDRRLEKHQEAYRLWQDLLFSVNDKEASLENVLACQNWWKENCLYLGDEARQSFRTAFRYAHHFHSISGSSPGEREKCFEKIEAAGKHIEEGVALIPLKVAEK